LVVYVLKGEFIVVKIAPSILAADFADLGSAIRAAEAAGADYIHVDVMDGSFVPNITVGIPVVAALRRTTRLPLDVHLMIAAPERYVADFADLGSDGQAKAAGADIITVHVEACPHLHRTVQQIRELGVRPGVVLNPATALETLREILPYVDLVLLMTVNPGFGGQSYIPTMTAKIARLAAMIAETGREIAIEVDGGIDIHTTPEVVAAGARVLVAGTAVFGHPGGVAGGIAALRAAAGMTQ
jgi:ribulose-phosphate 3-epimerase